MLKCLARRPAPKQSEVIVVRSERQPKVTEAIKQYDDVRGITLQDAALVARSSLDQAAKDALGDLLVIISPALAVEPNIVEELTKPMLEQPRVVAVAGSIQPSPTLSTYEALRFEQLEAEPFDLIAVRKSTWESHTFHGSGGLGSRWLERAATAGEVLHSESAIGYGTFVIEDDFRNIVRSTFCNRPEGAVGSLKSGIRDVIKDWEGIRRIGITQPGPIVRQAAKVRLAESIGRTRLKLFFGTQLTRTSID